MSGKKGFIWSPKRRNFGLGKKPDFAAKTALRKMYGANGHYQTQFIHNQRFSHFVEWLSNLDKPVRDLRLVTLGTIEIYAIDLSDSVARNTMKVAYAQNLVSTVNVTMLAVRRDRTIWLSPSQSVGARSYIRTIVPDATDEKIKIAVQLAEQDGNYRGAALILMARAFGMRIREASLANLNRLQKEAEEFGQVRVLEGTKGGRKSDDRTVIMRRRQRDALHYAVSTVSGNTKCLVDTNSSYREFINRCIFPVRKSLKQAGIRCPQDLRAEKAIERYEEKSGQFAPVKGIGPFDRDADIRGKEAAAKELGHGRISSTPAYVGKHHQESTGYQEENK